MTPTRILNTILAVLIIMICTDAMFGAFLLAILDLLGFGQATILWTEAALFSASLGLAVWLFRRVFDAECRLDEGTYD